MRRQNGYNLRRAFWLFKGFFPSLVGLVIPRQKNRIIFNSTRNEFYNFNSKYLFEYFIQHHPEYEAKYVINDSAKRAELNRLFGEEHRYFIETNTLGGMWYALQAGAWVTSAFETPVGGLFLRFRRFVYLLGHGTHFKAIVFNERRLPLSKRVYYHLMRLNFSAYLVTSQALIETYHRAYRCRGERLTVLGEPRHDHIYSPDLLLIRTHFGEKVLEERNILYAPTWRADGGLRLFPFDDMNWGQMATFLEEHRINLFLRMHPSFPEDLSAYTRHTDRIKILDNGVVEDISDVMGFFDMLITDYSSIFISYLLLEKPIVFLPYDLKAYDDRMGFIDNYEKLTPGPKPHTMDAFTSEIYRLMNEKSYYQEKRKQLSSFYNDYQENNCEMNTRFILEELEIS